MSLRRAEPLSPVPSHCQPPRPAPSVLSDSEPVQRKLRQSTGDLNVHHRPESSDKRAASDLASGTFHWRSWGRAGRPRRGTPRPSQEATGIPSLSGRAVARGARRVSRLKASDGLEEAGEAAREAFKRGLFQAPPEAST